MRPDLSENAILFDIETTGLSAARSHLYMIGAVSRRDGQWILTQWFLDRPSEEALLLQAFSEYLQTRPAAVLYTYNGDTFDLPYLKNKYAFYELPYPLDDADSRDIYRLLRPYRSLMGLTSMKQKDVERYAGIIREDTMTGKELIQVYQNYLRTDSSELLELLLLHNHDDLCGLLGIFPVMVLQTLFSGEFADVTLSAGAQSLSPSDDVFSPPDVVFSTSDVAFSTSDVVFATSDVIFYIKIPGYFPADLHADTEYCSLDALSGNDFCSLQVHTLQGTLMHFFADYKNYWYLPEEDQAIHSSVARYVDKEHRVKATAATCYQKATGFFLPQPSEIIQPVFRRFHKDKTAWLRPEDLAAASPSALRQYVTETLAQLLRDTTPSK